MGSFSINTTSKKLSECLASTHGIQTSNIKLVDYVVNVEGMQDEESFTEQEDSSLVIEINLPVDVDKMLETGIIGYDFVIEGLDNGEHLSIEGINFADDLKNLSGGNIDIGENDALATAFKIKEVQQLLVYEGEGEGNILTTKSAQFVDLQTTGNFQDLAKTFLTFDVSVDETVDLQMPLYAVASAATGIHCTHSQGDPSRVDDIIYYANYSGQITSLSKIRAAKLSEPPPSSFLGAVAQQAVPTMTQESVGATTVVVGSYVKISSPIFESIRRIEVPKRIWEDNPNELRVNFTPIFSSTHVANFSEAVIQREMEFFKWEIKNKKRELFSPLIPPNVALLSNDHGKINIEVTRGDPATTMVEITVMHFDVNQGVYENYGEPIIVNFDESFASTNCVNKRRLYNIPCMNYGPFKTHIQASVITDGESSIGTEILVPSVPHKLYDKHMLPDKVVVTTLNEIDGIRVTVSNAQDDYETIRLHRECLTVPKSSPQRHKFLGAENSASDIQFFDTPGNGLRIGQHYRYYATGEITRGGQPNDGSAQKMYERVQFSSDSIIERQFLENTIYRPDISLMSDGTFPAFLMSTITVTTAYDDMLASVAESLIDEFGTDEKLDILKSAGIEDTTKFVFYKVIRLNLNNGEDVFMGEFPSGATFVDEDENRNPSHRYQYRFNMCVIPPTGIEALMLGDEKAAGNLLMSEFVSATGMLPGPTKSDTAPTASAYDTGITKNIEIAATATSFFIKELKGTALEAEPAATKSLNLQWNVDAGTNAFMKSFYVICEYNGHTVVLASLYPGGSSLSYSYIDTVYFNEVGKKVYYVIGRLKDTTFTGATNKLTYTKSSPLHPAAALHTTVLEKGGFKGLDLPFAHIDI